MTKAEEMVLKFKQSKEAYKDNTKSEFDVVVKQDKVVITKKEQ